MNSQVASKKWLSKLENFLLDTTYILVASFLLLFLVNLIVDILISRNLELVLYSIFVTLTNSVYLLAAIPAFIGYRFFHKNNNTNLLSYSVFIVIFLGILVPIIGEPYKHFITIRVEGVDMIINGQKTLLGQLYCNLIYVLLLVSVLTPLIMEQLLRKKT